MVEFILHVTGGSKKTLQWLLIVRNCYQGVTCWFTASSTVSFKIDVMFCQQLPSMAGFNTMIDVEDTSRWYDDRLIEVMQPN